MKEDQPETQPLEQVASISPSDREEDLKKKREEDQTNVTKNIEEVTVKLSELELEMKKFGANIQQVIFFLPHLSGSRLWFLSTGSSHFRIF